MRTLDRIIAILDVVAGSAEPVAAAMVSRRVKLPLPTVSRLMRELAQRRYLQGGQPANGYALGSRLLELSYAARPTNLFNSLVQEMEWLRDVTEETVSLHVRSGEQRVCVCEIQSTQSVRRVVPVGLIVPLHFGATGMVLLAGASAPFVQGYIRRLNLDATAEQRMHEQIRLIRERGWAIAEDAWIAGLAGLAAPVREGDTVVASLVVSGPTFRWNCERMRRSVDDLLAAARRGSARLSGRPAERNPAMPDALASAI
ncbi:MAG: IclR family transcriptional regulator [Alphaproteobacteria bacterium]|nr:IclR family transcriptional regulator [Alphaproteobacteria bacterium]